jgi:hypothetical protein
MAKFQLVEPSQTFVRRPDQIQTYEHVSQLNYGMAVIYETLRMYPIVGGPRFLDRSDSNPFPGPQYRKAFGA